MREALRIAVAAICVGSAVFGNTIRDGDPNPRVRTSDWRRSALQNMRIGVGCSLERPADLALYRASGFTAFAVFDADSYDAQRSVWNYKSEEQVRSETAIARSYGFPLVVSLAIEPYQSIPQATDDEVRARIALWQQYGDDVIVGVSPLYDDVFLDRITVERQRHVYRLIKESAPDWYVFGMIGEFGFNATDEEVAALYDPAAFDHLIVLMYPYNVGANVTGMQLDHVDSADPDGDIARYIDRFIARMHERYFRQMRRKQLVLMVVQAFTYPSDPPGRIPRPQDVRIMAEHGSDDLRKEAGQGGNNAIAYCCWGGSGAPYAGLIDRPDWMNTVTAVHEDFDRRARSR